MAAIRENFVLVDSFSSTFSKFISLCQKAASSTTVVTASQSAYNDAISVGGAALAEMAGAGDRAANTMEETAAATRKAEDASGGAADKQKKMNQAMRDGAHAADGWSPS